MDALELLRADHRQVEAWFEEFASADNLGERQDLAEQICRGLLLHMQIEEEMLYPLVQGAMEDKSLHHEAVVEHDLLRKLIADVQASGIDDDYFSARIQVLAGLINHHFTEEEQAAGLFDEAEDAGIDLQTLGALMEQRRDELVGEGN
jgi:hemerythrin superfamily protein